MRAEPGTRKTKFNHMSVAHGKGINVLDLRVERRDDVFET